MKKSILMTIFCLSFSAIARDIKIITYNLNTTLLKGHKKGLKRVNEVIHYYGADIHLFHNSYNKASDILKTNIEHPYFTYNEKIKKRTGNIQTSSLPITEETFKSFGGNCSLWKVNGITRTRIQTSPNQFIDIYNTNLKSTKNKAWKKIETIERFIKRNSYDVPFLVNIEFKKDGGNEFVQYLKDRLNATDILSDYVDSNNLKIQQFHTSTKKRDGHRKSYLLFGSPKPDSLDTINVQKIFDGKHDENKYLKDAALLFHLSF